MSEERVAELVRELDEEVRERVAAGVCGCGCGEALTSTKGGRRYVRESHRQRAHRRRLELVAKAQGLPAHLSLRELRQYEPTGNRHADAQEQPQAPKRRRSAPRPGVTIYLPTVELAELVERELRPASDRHPELVPAAQAVEAALKRRRRRETPPPAAA